MGEGAPGIAGGRGAQYHNTKRTSISRYGCQSYTESSNIKLKLNKIMDNDLKLSARNYDSGVIVLPYVRDYTYFRNIRYYRASAE